MAASLAADGSASARAARDVLDDVDIVIVQHEYGLFAGPDGDSGVGLIEGLAPPSIVVATIALIQERALRQARLVAEQLQSAVFSRVVIEQAKGLVAGATGVDMDAAFWALRAHARSENVRLADVARGVADGRIASHEPR
ncbi:MAG: ANTAR domain-containing protein [Actinomycetota bacterium]|nr:ANTAR domain-containing protein [Actinomycetota bacterium]